MKILGLILSLQFLLLAQTYENECPCFKSPIQQEPSDDALKSALANGVIPHLRKHDVNNCTYRAWSSVMLKPEGTPPTVQSKDKDPQRDSWAAYDSWSCQYSAYSIMDGDPKTAWSAPGDGIDAVVIAMADLRRPVEIWAGFGKSKKLFNANARPKNITVYVLQAATQTGVIQSSIEFSNITVLAHNDYELKDQNGYQPLPFPKFTPRSESGQTFLAIEIHSVYPGKKHPDVGISEIHTAQ